MKKNDFGPTQETMSRKELEKYFTAIQQRFDEMDEKMDVRFDEMDVKFDEQKVILKNILDIVGVYDIERKEIKSTLWEHDRRLLKLEKHAI